MADYTKFNSFSEAVAEGKHDFESNTLKVALTNTAPVPTDTKLSDLTAPITSGIDTMTLVKSSSGQTGGTYKYIPANLTMTATGSVGPFRYVVIYDDTSTDDLLVCCFDFGTSISRSIGETLTLDFQAGELFSLT